MIILEGAMMAHYQKSGRIKIGVWKKSSFSNPSGNCTEATVTESELEVLVRDTKVSRAVGDKAPVLRISLTDWQSFISDYSATDGRDNYIYRLSDGSI